MARAQLAFRSWLPLAMSITLLCGIAYVTAQQVYRMSANDPQSWMARDALLRLADGEEPAAIVGPPVGDVAELGGPFLVVFDRELKPIAWSATQNGAAPAPPSGVLKGAQDSGSNEVTWQPAPGLRFATVTAASKDWVVFAARSLTQVEKRISDLGTLVVAGWVAALSLTLVVCWGIAVPRGERIAG